MTTPADQAAAERVVLAWKAGTLPEGDVKMLLDQAIEQARREEREACAKIAARKAGDRCTAHEWTGEGACGLEIAAAIRARAQEE